MAERWNVEDDFLVPTWRDVFMGWFTTRRWGRLGRWWRRRCRRIDRAELFVLMRTRDAIAWHILIDTAWQFVDEWDDEPEAQWFRAWHRDLAQMARGRG